MKTSREKSHCDATELGPCHPPSRAFVGENAIASVARVAKSVGRPRDEDKQARIDNLLHVPELLFLEKGYDNVSLQMIARSARVAVRTIYVKFGGKVGLLNAVIEAGRARYFAGMVDVETDKRAMIDILADFSLRFLEFVNSRSHKPFRWRNRQRFNAGLV
jgi:AcrR family transcriptional regulator